ncbi:MAG: DUF6263 family protein [Planctomycetaceae bacterium]
MKQRMLISAGAVLIVAGIAAVAGWWRNDEQAADTDPQVPTTQITTAPVTAAPLPQAAPLQLNLKVGDRFPLLKTVEQTLSQSSHEGLTKSGSRVELLLEIQVDEVHADGRKLLSVRYHRVRYSQDVAGRKVDYRSDDPAQAVPAEALPYHGLIGNGFSFWVGADNQVIEPVGFDEFLARCVRDVPEPQRQAVLARFSRVSAAEGIANFVDDSIGLLPYHSDPAGSGGAVRVGDDWTRRREILDPMPLQLQTRYTLRELSETVAEIDILGTIAPSAPAAAVEQVSSEIQVTVRGGHSVGSCTIDRKTGLPIRSQVRRYLDMHVRRPDGAEFLQRKEVNTTIRAFPAQGATVEAPSSQ